MSNLLRYQDVQAGRDHSRHNWWRERIETGIGTAGDDEQGWKLVRVTKIDKQNFSGVFSYSESGEDNGETTVNLSLWADGMLKFNDYPPLTSCVIKMTAERIDGERSMCLSEAASTYDMNQCSGEALTKMDTLLNELYKELMGKLTPEKQALLKDAQRKWLAFREAEGKLSYDLDPAAGGTLQSVNANDFAYRILKQRVVDFENYRDGLEGY